MNTSTTTIAATVAIAAAALIGAAGLVAHHTDAAQPQQQAIVKLERVVITGKRMNGAETRVAQHIEKLPRVLVEGRRADAAMQLASACTGQQLC